MVDVNEYAKQLAARRGTLEAQKKQVAGTKPVITKEQLLGSSREARRAGVKQFEQQKTSAVSQINQQLAEQQKLEQELADYNKAQAEYNAAIAQQEAARKEASKGSGRTAAEVRATAQEVKRLRKLAGTYGENLPYNEEVKILNKYLADEKANIEGSQIKLKEDIAEAIQKGVPVNIAPEGIYIEQPAKEISIPVKAVTGEYTKIPENVPRAVQLRGSSAPEFLPYPSLRAKQTAYRKEVTGKYAELRKQPFSIRYPYLTSKAEGGQGFNVVGSSSEGLIYLADKLVAIPAVRKTLNKYAPELLEPKRSSLTYVPGNLLLFSFFGPAISSGAAAKTKAKLKQVSKTKVTSGIKFEDLETGVREAYITGNKDVVREAYRKALATGNRKLIAESERLLQNALGRQTAKEIIKDIKAQEIVKSASVRKVPGRLIAPGIEQNIQPAVVSSGVIPSAFAGQGTYDISEEAIRNRQRILTTLGIKEESRSKEGLGTIMQERFKVAESSTQMPSLSQVTKVGLGTVQIPKLNLSERTAQQTRQALKTRQVQRTAQAMQQPTRQTFKSPPGSKLPLPFNSSSLKLGSKEKEAGRGKVGFNAFAKQRGRFYKLNKMPLRTRQEALNLSKYIVDRTLSASGKVAVVKAKKFSKARVPYISQDKFRDYRISKGKRIPTPNSFIEKKEFRLDTPNEVQTIQKFKRSKAFKSIFKK